jgi:hypothetical protein
MGTGVFIAAAPVLLSVVCIDRGPAGWVLLGGVLLTAGLGIGPIARWAQRRAVHLVDA